MPDAMKLRFGHQRYSARSARRASVQPLESRVLLSAQGVDVTTGAATNVVATSATLTATVNAMGQTTSAYFQYSADPSFPPTGSTRQIGSGFDRPYDAVADAQGDVYVADNLNGTAKLVLANGTIEDIGPGLTDPTGVAVDSSGDVFISASGSSVITEVFPNGSSQSIGSGFNQPNGIAIDSSGDLFVADTGDSTIKELLPDDTVLSLGYGFNGPTGVAVDSSGDVFVADSGNGQIKEILPTGAVNTIRAGFSYPTGVAVDSSGDVFVADNGDGIVSEILAGGVTRKISSAFQHPESVSVDAAGNLYVADEGADKVVELSPVSQSATPSQINNSSAITVTGGISGLTPGTTYYYRALASGPGGLQVGATESFTTPAPLTFGVNPINIVYGIPLNNSMINGAASPTGTTIVVPGTFSFTTAAGSLLGTGTHTGVEVTFTPSDTASYEPATTTITINVDKAAPSVAVADAGGVFTGSAYPATATVTGISGPPGTTLEGVAPALTYYTGPSAAGVGSATAPSAEGTYTVIAAYPGSADYTAASSEPVTFTIGTAGPAHVMIDLSNLSASYDGSVHFAAVSTLPSGSGTTLTYSIKGWSIAAPTDVGLYTVLATASGANTTGSATGTLVIAPSYFNVSLPDLNVAYNGRGHASKARWIGVAPQYLDVVEKSVRWSYKNLNNGIVTGKPPIDPGEYSVLVSFAGNADFPAVAAASTGSTITINAFADLPSASTIVRGKPIQLKGKLASGSEVHRGTVTIGVAGQNITVKLRGNGTFSQKISTATLPAGSYIIQYTYAGPGKLGTVSYSSMLTVSYAIRPRYDTGRAYRAGQTIPIAFSLADANRRLMTTDAIATATAISSNARNASLSPLPSGNPASGLSASPAPDGVYHMNLATTGLAPGRYELYVTIAGDVISHPLPFVIG